MAKRGFFAEMNHQAALADQRRRQQLIAQQRMDERAAREAEKARIAYERARGLQNAAEVKVAEQLLITQGEAAAKQRNDAIALTFASIDNILAATLDVDDWIDLDLLKNKKVVHPDIELGDLEIAIPEVVEPTYPERPQRVQPVSPGGLNSLFGGKRRAAQIEEKAETQYNLKVATWEEAKGEFELQYNERARKRAFVEIARQAQIQIVKRTYAQQCQERDSAGIEYSNAIEKLINDLAFDVKEAIEEYVELVFSNSYYPDAFPVTHEVAFELQTRELTLLVRVPGPESIPTEKEIKYVRSSGEMTSTSLSQSAIKNRYNSAIMQVAVRTFHEVFESDRNGRIKTIALTVHTDAINKATGLPDQVPLVIASADLETFKEFDLTNVEPLATLKYLSASVSKNAFDLQPADTSRGVRTRR
jgi:restriction system protein